MRGRLLVGAFVLGLVAVGVAAAGLQRNWWTTLSGRRRSRANASQGQAQATFRLSDDGMSLDYKLIAVEHRQRRPGAHPPRRAPA